MIRLIERLAFLALLVSVIALTITSLPLTWETHLQGGWLMAHMMSSGLMVVALPLFAIARLLPAIERQGQAALHRFAFWCVVVLGTLTIATMFACMLPIASTEELSRLISLHGLVGIATSIATLVVLVSRFAAPRQVKD
ncbi:MAG: hypothetical protein AAGA03_11840 [Planctomycetota bacterium]